ncbi:unnamed protein product [Staurois parvus]|uniref:Secreted protein n=1 Tax=Staurois parvus TaxID=386267 RepID=A0ABN9FYX8_9NEOB|nr:unnamed protein product [Staurois parvus]
MDLPIMVGLTCLVGCSTRAGQQVLSAIRDSTLQSAKHLRLIAGVFKGWPDLQSVPWCVFFHGPLYLVTCIPVAA